jgi:tol-pal system protein YbgF
MKCRTSRFFLPFLGLLLLLVTSCVYDKEFAYLNDQVIALNKRVRSLEDGMENRLDPMRSSQAETQSDLDQMRGEIRRLSGRIEENEHLLKRAVERDLTEQDSMRATLTQLSDKVATLDAMVEQQHRYLGLESPAPGRAEEAATAAPLKEEPAARTAPAPAQLPAAAKDTDVYEKSLALFRNGKHEEAIAGFKGFLRTHPKSDQAENAQFWVGESHFALRQYEQAILAYQEVIKNFPKGNKVANATLRQGMAFLEINDKTSAKLLLDKVVKNYPNTSEAKIAQQKLTTLK